MLRQAAAADDLGPEMLAELDALKSARAEIAALRGAIQQVHPRVVTMSHDSISFIRARSRTRYSR